MLTTVQISGLQTYGYHGLFEEERSLGQKFVFDIDAKLAQTATHQDDRLARSVRYDAIIDAVVELAAETVYYTLEALGEAIAAGLMQRFPSIESVRVTVSKISPPIPHVVNSVGVAIHLSRTEIKSVETQVL